MKILFILIFLIFYFCNPSFTKLSVGFLRELFPLDNWNLAIYINYRGGFLCCKTLVEETPCFKKIIVSKLIFIVDFPYGSLYVE